MMEFGKARLAILVALLLASLAIILPGCTSNKYVPCCVRSGIFDDTGAVQPDPSCMFQNGTKFSDDCQADAGEKSAAFCANGTLCGSIASQDGCEKTSNCLWNDSVSPHCTGAGLARWALPVCTDLVPKSCVNDKCSAMVCGYANLRPAPPPASQDWNVNTSKSEFDTAASGGAASSSAVPANDMQTPAVGLQGTTCDVVPMNQKLYNKMKSARGSLWVNSFRFGVGSSFSDYEASRYFFPASDRACAANPYAKVDRFTVYLNESNTYCAQVNSYITCNKLPGLAFWDETTCELYCGGGSPPYQCSNVTGATHYKCSQDGFAYNDYGACSDKCGIISPDSCTNNVSKFPFLSTDSSSEARIRMKYVADYMVDNSNPIPGGSQPCVYLAGPTGSYAFGDWRIGDEHGEAIRCDDFAHDGLQPYQWTDGPWFFTQNCSVVNAWQADGWAAHCNGADSLGSLRTFFDNHAYSSLDIDYDYYSQELLKQYPYAAQDSKLPFECETGADCLSGTCDNTYYKRGMCTDADTNLSKQCFCSTKNFGTSMTPYPSCWFTNSPDALPIYSETNIFPDPYVVSVGNHRAGTLTNGGALFNADDSVHFWDGTANQPTTHFIYYSPVSDHLGIPLDKPATFSACQVSPNSSSVEKCIMKDRYFDGISVHETQQPVVRDPDTSDGLCHYTLWSDSDYQSHLSAGDLDGNFGFPGNTPSTDSSPFPPRLYWVYDFDLNSPDTSKQVHQGRFGICKLNGDAATPSVAPHLVLHDLGWCAGCSYATLAVQKVSWGQPNPGGEGSPRQYSCYEYRGDFNYVPGELPYGGGIGTAPGSTSPSQTGMVRNPGISTPSTEIVRKSSNPSAYEYDYDGNLYQGPNGDGYYTYVCQDGWHANGGWWSPEEIPTPSAPFLKEKLTSYLQSSVMPILDEVDEKTSIKYYSCSQGAVSVCRATLPGCGEYCPCTSACPPIPFKSTCTDRPGAFICPVTQQPFPDPGTCHDSCGGVSNINQGYNPLSICNTYGGNGGVLHVVGDSSMLSWQPLCPGYGNITAGQLSADTLRYFGLESAPPNQALNFDCYNGGQAIITRADLLKQNCTVPPLVGLEILPGETLSSLIGTDAAPGKLKNFFFNSTQAGYSQHVARGTPDKTPDQVDMLMQDWYPMCDAPGIDQSEKEIYEIEMRMDFSRAFLGNFSKPSLIWKFAFPTGTKCNTSVFLDYLFNNTGPMVDSGITGIIYSDWSVYDGAGFGPSVQSYNDASHGFSSTLQTGLSSIPPVVRGTPIHGPYSYTMALDDMATGKGDLFCALQSYSKRAIGYIPLTYGQKLYAENQTCMCAPCTDYDYVTGACDYAALQSQDPNPNLAQLYCNDGTTCALAAGQQSYASKCEPRCMNYTACKVCSSGYHANDASFCRINAPGSPPTGISLPYANISDIYWEFAAGLSPSEKCCLVSGDEGQNGSKYTYVKMTGTKQQSEFLQYPTRGDFDVDCGRAPDTSVLSYCNIRVPLSQREIACVKIDNPPTPISITQSN